jgi:hypothetical protein
MSYPRARVGIHRAPPISIVLRPLREQHARYAVRPFADLFARGILHPKLF